MGSNQQMLMSYAGGYSNYTAVDFDGTNDWLTRGGVYTGLTDGSQGIMSFWFRIDGGDGTTRKFSQNSSGGKFDVGLITSNVIRIQLRDATAALVLLYDSTTTFTAGATWHHVVASWDTNFSAGNKLIKVMVDGVQDTGSVTDGSIAFSIDYATAITEYAIASNGASLGTQLFSGCLSEFYFTNTYLDVSQAGNLAKFYSGGKPVNLGANGSTPTGVQPIVFLHVASSGAASDFGTNLGSGGGMTITGSLDLCSTAP